MYAYKLRDYLAGKSRERLTTGLNQYRSGTDDAPLKSIRRP